MNFKPKTVIEWNLFIFFLFSVITFKSEWFQTKELNITFDPINQSWTTRNIRIRPNVKVCELAEKRSNELQTWIKVVSVWRRAELQPKCREGCRARWRIIPTESIRKQFWRYTLVSLILIGPKVITRDVIFFYFHITHVITF